MCNRLAKNRIDSMTPIGKFAIPALAGALIVGCSFGPKEKLSAVAAATVPGGWTEYKSADAKYSIAVPSGWSDKIRPLGMLGGTGDMPQGVKDMLGDIPAQQEQLEKEEAEQSAKNAAAKGYVLRCYDNQSRIIVAEIPTGLVVQVGGGSGSLKGDAESYRKNFKSDDVKSSKSVTLPMGPAEECVIQSTDQKGDVVNRIAYIFSHDGQRIVLEFRQTNNTGIENVARDIADTFRIQI